jgi:hypothetical protein
LYKGDRFCQSSPLPAKIDHFLFLGKNNSQENVACKQRSADITIISVRNGIVVVVTKQPKFDPKSQKYPILALAKTVTFSLVEFFFLLFFFHMYIFRQRFRLPNTSQ